MNKREFAKLKKWTDTLTDEQLKKEYYDSVFDSLGSQTEEMYERGYDIADILEREKYEKWLSRRSDMLEKICSERGIKLWEEYEYFGYYRHSGPFSTGYSTWVRTLPEIFKTVEDARSVYMEYLHILACSWKDYDRDSIRICEIKLNPAEKLPWKEIKVTD